MITILSFFSFFNLIFEHFFNRFLIDEIDYADENNALPALFDEVDEVVDEEDNGLALNWPEPIIFFETTL